jgi:hypothetical protein
MMMERTYKPLTKAQQKEADAKEKLRMKAITKDFKTHLGKPAKMHFFDGTVIEGLVKKQGKDYYLTVRLKRILGRGNEEIQPVKISDIKEFLGSLRKIHIPIVY